MEQIQPYALSVMNVDAEGYEPLRVANFKCPGGIWGAEEEEEVDNCHIAEVTKFFYQRMCWVVR